MVVYATLWFHLIFQVVLLLASVDSNPAANSSSSSSSSKKRKSHGFYSSCKLIHETSSGVCIDGGLKDYPTKKDLPKYIHSLFLSQNRLSHLNSSFLETFSKLRELDISQNHIDYIKRGAFTHGRLLRKLDLSNNRLTLLDASTFEGAKNLLTLDLSHNWIRHLSSNAFRGLRKLNRLWLQDNYITTLRHDTFNGLKGNNIEFIFLQNNRIEEIHRGSFGDMPQLVLCQLTNNKLKRMTKEVVVEIGMNARFINWEGNPWHCDCDFSDEVVLSLQNASLKEPLPQIHCQTQAVTSCTENPRTEYSIATVKTSSTSWSGGAIAGMFFAVLLAVSILCICLSLACGIKMKNQQRKIERRKQTYPTL